jgi:hypothetical protein
MLFHEISSTTNPHFKNALAEVKITSQVSELFKRFEMNLISFEKVETIPLMKPCIFEELVSIVEKNGIDEVISAISFYLFFYLISILPS